MLFKVYCISVLVVCKMVVKCIFLWILDVIKRVNLIILCLWIIIVVWCMVKIVWRRRIWIFEILDSFFWEIVFVWVIRRLLNIWFICLENGLFCCKRLFLCLLLFKMLLCWCCWWTSFRFKARIRVRRWLLLCVVLFFCLVLMLICGLRMDIWLCVLIRVMLFFNVLSGLCFVWNFWRLWRSGISLATITRCRVINLFVCDVCWCCWFFCGVDKLVCKRFKFVKICCRYLNMNKCLSVDLSYSSCNGFARRRRVIWWLLVI